MKTKAYSINYNFIKKVKDYMLPRPSVKDYFASNRAETLNELEIITIVHEIMTI